jgi:hypothetical protein
VNKKPKSKLDSMSKRIEFRYSKSNYHRVINVNGAWGGLTAHSQVHMSIYSELRALPDLQEMEVLDNNKPPVMTKNLVKQNTVIREVEASLIMSPAVARAIAKWLNEKADEFEKLTGKLIEVETENKKN